MSEILLFHHARGITSGVHRIAAELGAAGHRVHLPDLFDGQRFVHASDGVAHAEAIGFQTVIDRGLAAAEGLPRDLVVIGISLGVMPAQALAQTRPGIRAAVLVAACVPVDAFGDRWPDGVPVQIHGMASDPVFWGEGDLEAAQHIVATTPSAELFVYPGDGHLFVDPTDVGFDPVAAAQVMARTLDLLARIGP